jgi:ABC-type transporter Mla subunit MlaD
MATTTKKKAAPAAPRGSETARKRCEQNDRAMARVAASLEAAQKDLAAIRGSVGSGASDLRKDVAKLLRDARRDVTKMSKVVRRDLERLQQDVTAAASGKPAPARGRRGTQSARKPATRSRGR